MPITRRTFLQRSLVAAAGAALLDPFAEQSASAAPDPGAAAPARPPQIVELDFWRPGYAGDGRAGALVPNGDIWLGSSSRVTIFSPDGVYKGTDKRAPGQINAIVFSANGDPIMAVNDGFVAIYEGDRV